MDLVYLKILALSLCSCKRHSYALSSMLHFFRQPQIYQMKKKPEFSAGADTELPLCQVSVFRCACRMALLMIAVVRADVAYAQDYPAKLVRIITAQAGGGGDLAARLIAQGLSGTLGQQAIVDNRAGFLSIETVARATPDGYTLLLYGSSMWIVPLLRNDASWDALKDFAPITMPAYSPNLLVIHPSLPANSVKELIAIAKARPGQLNYSSGAAGSANQLGAELLKAMAGVKITQINYKGTAPALNGLLTGEVQLIFVNLATVMSHVKSGRLRALALTSLQPSALAPGFPTMAMSGLPGYELTSKWGLFAPVGTAPAIINRLHQDMVQILNRQDVKERLFATGVETVGSSPVELAAAMKSEMSRLGKLIKDAGIRAE